MKVDVALTVPLEQVAARAATVADLGADGIFTYESAHDPFAPLVLAARSGIDLYPAVAIALPRNPIHLASIAWDLQAYSGGHFLLGLGSQVRAHIERRFGVGFEHPVDRMRDLVEALKAILHAWQDGGKLDYRGEYYRHTLMTPAFDAGPNPHGVPPVVVASVGPLMTRMAGEFADGALLHPFHTARFFRERWRPTFDEGVERSGADPSACTVIGQTIVVTGRDEQTLAEAEQGARANLAFYASTPAYLPPLELHGWQDVQPELNALSKQGRWQDMPALIDDEMLAAFTIHAEPARVAATATERFGTAVDRVALNIYGAGDDETLGTVLAGFH